MSGYLGGDAVTEHTLVIAENAIHAIRQRVDSRPSLTECEDCGDEIDPRRVLAIGQIGCRRCFACQSVYDKRPKQKIKMLDRVL